MPLPFEFVVEGAPVSQQARRKRLIEEWKQEVKHFAELRWGADQPFDGEVMVTISYFYEYASLDVDNIPKPILDALIGLVYPDDSLVSDLLCRKRRVGAALDIRRPSALLLESHGRSKQFLHVVVVTAPSQEVQP